MEMENGLTNLNVEILNHIKHISNKTSRFSAAVKLGLSVHLVEKVCELDSFQVKDAAKAYAVKGHIITCNNLSFGERIESRSLALDSFFKASRAGVEAR
ncbi:hypothetical protein [Thiomicrorhabdus aquaedulcis]|uniref:hypothetical protein n=1 Tax=Thiomicrorhabdus aquaedulcis TaxID=2211106 RepID=UPI000FD97BB6|nr:hypothetical protein [Thiomicrorhabdus aquaedulcis]